MLSAFSLAGIPASVMVTIYFWVVLAPKSGIGLKWPH